MQIRYSRYLEKPLKYRNKRSCNCIARHWHDSIKEANYCTMLYMLKKNGDIKDYETQVTFDFKVAGHKICSHRVDFLITDKAGAQEVHEVKANITMTPLWNIKRKLFESLYENIPYIVVK